MQRGDLREDLRANVAGRVVCVTFMTIGELFKGAYLRGWGGRRMAELERWLRDVVVLPYDAEVSRQWGGDCQPSVNVRVGQFLLTTPG
jgi:predicted nucleic acid-binding protein